MLFNWRRSAHLLLIILITSFILSACVVPASPTADLTESSSGTIPPIQQQPVAMGFSLLQRDADTFASDSSASNAKITNNGPRPPVTPQLVIVPTPTTRPSPTPYPTPKYNGPTIAISDLATTTEAVEPSVRWSQTENFLILGTDRRPNWRDWRTDVLMIVGLDRANGRAAVLSVPRDLYVEIPGTGWGRINQVDFLGEKVLRVEGGGPALVSHVLEKTIGIKTNHWVRVEMQGFEALVDAVGGVPVTLDCPFAEPIFNLDTQEWEYYTLPAGEVLMDGVTARWFVRLRLRGSDIGRSARQRQFLWALRAQVLNKSIITRFPELWGALNGLFATDLTLWDMLGLINVGLSYDASNVRAGGITLSDLRPFTTENGAAVLGIDDPDLIRAVVEGVWDAPAMASTNQQEAATCPPVPTGVPNVTTEPDFNPEHAQVAEEAIDAGRDTETDAESK